MTLCEAVTGTYDLKQLGTLLHPVAWSGTVPHRERMTQERALADLVHEAKVRLAMEPDATGVRIMHGEIVGLVYR